MTSGLRKTHKYIWLLIGVAVPLIIAFAIKDIPVFSLEKDSARTLETSEPDSVIVSENELIKVSLFENDSARTLEIILKSPLRYPSSIVYTLSDDEKETLIGQLTAVGIYNFRIEEFPKGIILYDVLKKIQITKLTF